ncbi:hypothetical protein LLG95_02690 [bacterium]|nr:hypothetical protein [bacterium]
MNPKPKYPLRFMAIDAGSNATKYRVWELKRPGEAWQIAERRYPMRIGEGVFATGRIAPETISAAADVYRSIRGEMDALGVTAYRAVTTSAAREAQNTADLIEAIRRAANIDIEIIDDDREAQLIGMGVLSCRPDANAPCVIADIGGGSTEIIQARGGRIERAVSTPIGAVRLKEMFFRTIPPSAADIDAVEDNIREVLDRMIGNPPIDPDTELIGSGGTITALTIMAGKDTSGLTLGELDTIIGRLRGMSVEQMCAYYPIDQARAEVILSGSLVLRAVMRKFGMSRLILIRSGVGDGLLREYMMR